MTEVREKAKQLGLKPAKMKKADLIRAIQEKEGNFPCFQTAIDFCDQYQCCWRDDCFGNINTSFATKEFISTLT